MTFSIAAVDPKTGDTGVAVASKFLAVGSIVPWLEAGVGAIATQALCNATYGPEGLKLLRGNDAKAALASLLAADPGRDRRQVGIVDGQGVAASHTGAGCHGWAGHRTGAVRTRRRTRVRVKPALSTPIPPEYPENPDTEQSHSTATCRRARQ